MKYKYSKFLFLIQVMLALFCVYILAHDFKLYSTDTEIYKHSDLLGFVGFFAVLLPFIGEYINRFIEFKDEHIVFNSFRVKKKLYNFSIRYEDILSIEAVNIPILGIYKVKVKAKNIPCIIPVTWCMKRHNELFCKICKYAKKYNPKVYIDSCLIKHLEKKGFYNENQ